MFMCSYYVWLRTKTPLLRRNEFAKAGRDCAIKNSRAHVCTPGSPVAGITRIYRGGLRRASSGSHAVRRNTLAIVQAQLRVSAPQVPAHRLTRNEKFFGDTSVVLTLRHAFEDFAFTPCELS